MRQNNSFYLFVLLAALLWCTSCRLPTEDLTPAEYDIVDTLYNAALPDFRKELDSICEAHQDSLIKLKADSLVELQLIEIKKLINRK